MKKYPAVVVVALVGLISLLEIWILFLEKAETLAFLSVVSRLLIAGYLSMVIAGLAFPFLRVATASRIRTVLAHLFNWMWFRWWAIAALLSLHLVVVSYYSQQSVWPGQWTTLLCTLVIIQWISLIQQSKPGAEFGPREWLIGTVVFFAVAATAELYQSVGPGLFWLAAGFTFILVFVHLAYDSRVSKALIAWRRTHKRLCEFLAGIVLATPLFYYWLVGATVYLTLPKTLSLVLLIASGMAAFLITDGDRLASVSSGYISAAVICILAAFSSSLTRVLDTPFSLTWSEGNRFYDYSLIFGQYLYEDYGHIEPLYNAPGRYGLWGILFLIPDLPIWVHRLWNILLDILPSLLAGWFLTRRISDKPLRLMLNLWFVLFFVLLAPLHPPFLIIAILIFAFMYEASMWKRGASLVVASLYASVARWTWLPITGVLGALNDLILHYPKRRGSILQRILPGIILALLGILPGLPVGQRVVTNLPENPALSQPLLWFRLFPNQTFALGIVLSILITTGPLLVLLFWWMRFGRWKLDWIQQIAIWIALAGFLAGGLVVSIKIGGGGDLHNLDMYLMTLATVVGLAVHMSAAEGNFQPAAWPGAARWILTFILLLPISTFTPLNPRVVNLSILSVPNAEQSQPILKTIQTEMDHLDPGQEILFMDQRQLVAFGYLHPETFSNEYEKKYMMDQAMQGDREYFRTYYEDLADQRFGVIITEPLKTRYKPGEDGFFAAENDAWVKWVSAPTLCFYKPIATFENARLQILVPKAKIPDDCARYLE